MISDMYSSLVFSLRIECRVLIYCGNLNGILRFCNFDIGGFSNVISGNQSSLVIEANNYSPLLTISKGRSFKTISILNPSLLEIPSVRSKTGMSEKISVSGTVKKDFKTKINSLSTKLLTTKRHYGL